MICIFANYGTTPTLQLIGSVNLYSDLCVISVCVCDLCECDLCEDMILVNLQWAEILCYTYMYSTVQYILLYSTYVILL